MAITLIDETEAQYPAEVIRVRGMSVRLANDSTVLLEPRTQSSVSDGLYLPLGGGTMAGNVTMDHNGIVDAYLQRAYTRYLVVNQGGGGDSTTVSGACAQAAAGGATPAAPWQIVVHPGRYVEDPELPLGTHLRGYGQRTAVIAGQLTFHNGSTVCGVTIAPPGNDSNSLCVRFINDYNTGFINYHGVLDDVNIVIAGVNTGTVAAISCEGSGTLGLLYVRNSYIYPANRYTVAGSTAQIAAFHLLSDYLMYVEVLNTHVKTSTGSNNPVQEIFALVDCVAPSTGFGYVHAAAGVDWEAVYGDYGNTPRPILAKSLNTVHAGIIWDGATTDKGRTRQPLLITAFPTTNSFYNRILQNLEVRGVAELAGGVTVGGVQVLSAARALTGVTADTSILTSGTLPTARGGTGADGSALAANRVLASPSSGSGSVAYRSLTSADIPNLDASKINTGSLSTTGALVMGADGVQHTITGECRFQRAAATSNTNTGFATGDTFLRYAIKASGDWEAGSGSAARDTRMRRSAASEVTFDHPTSGNVNVKVTGSLFVGTSGVKFLSSATNLLGIQPPSGTDISLRLLNSSATALGYLGSDGTDFGLKDSAGNFAVMVRTNRTALRGPAVIYESGTDWDIPKIVISSSAPSSGSSAPGKTIWFVV